MWNEKVMRGENPTTSSIDDRPNDIAINVDDGSLYLPAPVLPNWHIPRPSLWKADSECPCHMPREHSKPGRGSKSSQGSSSSNTSTQSGSSGSLLLTAANLAALRCETVAKAPDTMSVASSTHFTVVNGITRRKAQPLPTCCCHSHQLTALVITMSIIFLIAIIVAVLFLESVEMDRDSAALQNYQDVTSKY
ncbi:hypothetical protein C0J52_03627 [Blattella germanica]|nr:hypothetical protein C0J52_03627 [Blattella germanica]